MLQDTPYIGELGGLEEQDLIPGTARFPNHFRTGNDPNHPSLSTIRYVKTQREKYLVFNYLNVSITCVLDTVLTRSASTLNIK